MKKIAISIITTLLMSPMGFAAAPSNPLFLNNFIWVGTPNPTPPDLPVQVWNFAPLNSLPSALNPLWGWFGFESSTKQACELGLSNMKVGPYGTVEPGTPSCGNTNTTNTQTTTQTADTTAPSSGAGSKAAVEAAVGGLSTQAAITTAVVVGATVGALNDSGSAPSSPTSTSTTSNSNSTSTATQ